MKILISVITLLTLTGCQKPFLKVVSSSFAKEFCSCYFVVEQDVNYCENNAKQIVPISKYKIDKEKKTIMGFGLGQNTLVEYRGKRLGCRIVN